MLPLYQFYEMGRSWMTPVTYWAEASAKMFSTEHSWLSHMPMASRIAAGYELIYRIGKEYEKPLFGIVSIDVDGKPYPVVAENEIVKPFCKLKRFQRFASDADSLKEINDDPTVLIVAPLSGHHATLLRDTVTTMLQTHKVYITDWLDARTVPTSEGDFHLDTYVEYIEEFIRHIGCDSLHVMAVCQPVVPVLGAISLMAARGEPTPKSMILMGGPVDARKSPTSVNSLATEKSIHWFETNLVHTVPTNYPGHGRRVYPGFMQHAGFIAMNPEHHMQSHYDFYQNLLQGDMDDAESHRKFYDEYNAVLDMDANYYLETVQTVFKDFALPNGTWQVNGETVDPTVIKDTALLTIEGERDDISGQGQTQAAIDLCSGIAKKNKEHLLAEGAGHYGIFSGRRWRTMVYPQVKAFIQKHNK